MILGTNDTERNFYMIISFVAMATKGENNLKYFEIFSSKTTGQFLI